MPELPEVETVVRDLRPLLLGRRLVAVELGDPKLTRPPGLEPAVGQRLVGLVRRAKWMVWRFERTVWLGHLRMTGKWLPADHPAIPEAVRRRRTGQWRVALRFEGLDVPLVLFDKRRFATLVPCADPEAWFLRRGVAPEPLTEPRRALVHLGTALARTARPIKSALLDERVVAGVGNIYADEALFRARIDPAVPACALTSAAVERLFEAISAVLAEAIAKRGTTAADYLTIDGEPGLFRRYLQVYRRTGLPCPRCGTPIARRRIGGRSSHFCPTCQPPGAGCAPGANRAQ